MRIAKLLTIWMLWLACLIPEEALAQPVVIGQPADTAVCNGGHAAFYVLAVNTVAYQWQENDGVGWYNIDGSITYAQGFTTPVLTISDANLGLNGYQYRCVVTDGDNISVTSDHATLGVNEPPVITINPMDATVCKNEVAYFNTAALYADSYQWQESVGAGWIDITNNAFYSGVTEPNLMVFTTTGMNGFRYRCRIVNGSCPDTTSFGMLFVNPTPTLQTVTGGGSFCFGGSGVSIGLTDSEAGIAYHMYRNGVATGVVITGTGEAISFGIFTQPGTYNVIAINGSTSCAIPMLNAVEVVVHPLPVQQQLIGGGSYCDGQAPPEVFLASSQQGITYELFRNGTSTGNQVSGTGFTLSFGPVSETGFYTVTARNPATECMSQMTGNVQVIKNQLPQIFASADQTIGQGETASLSAQVNGSNNYLVQWQPSAYVQHPQQTSTPTIPLYQSRWFTVSATDLISQCQSLTDSLKVIVTGGPLQLTLTATSSNICPGNEVSISSSVSGGSGTYSYAWSSNPPGFTSSNPNITVQPAETTTYSLSISDGNGSLMKSLTVVVHPVPASQVVTGGGNYCQGNEGLIVGLSGSQTGVQYQLRNNGQLLLSKNGTGSALTFGNFTEAGQYSVLAVSSPEGCQAEMTGVAQINAFLKPIADAGPEQMIDQGESALLQGTASSGSGTYQFSWSPAAYLINPNSANAATVPLTATRQFQLQVSDQVSGCISTPDQTVVFVSGSPVLQVEATAGSYNICPGEVVQLTALASGGSGNYTYAWQSVPEGFVSNIFNPDVTPQATTTYKVTVSDGFLNATDQFTITVRPKPQSYAIEGGGSYCTGNQGPEISLTDSEPMVYYSLLKNGTETGILRQGTGEALGFGPQQAEGQYQIKGFSPVHLCEAMMDGTAAVTMIPLPVVDAGADATIAYNATHLLQAIPGSGTTNFSVQWSPANLIQQPNALTSYTLPLTTTTQFSVVLTDNESGCVSIADQKTVYVSGTAMQVEILTEGNSVCRGETIRLEALASGGTGSYDYYWTSDPAGFYAGSGVIEVSPDETTTYHVMVSDGLQTVGAAFIVTVNPLPQPFSITGGGNLCHPENELPIGLSGSQPGHNYQLFLDETPLIMLSGTGNALTFGMFSEGGVYRVLAQSPGQGCQSWMEGTATITIENQVIADAGPDKTILTGGVVLLEAQLIGNGSNTVFNWNPANKLQNPTALQPTTIALNETTVFRLTAGSAGSGCQASVDEVTIFVQGQPIQLSITTDFQHVCPGEAVHLIALANGGNGSFTYNWTSLPAGFTSNVFNPTFYPEVPTSFFVTVSDGSQTASASIEIGMNAQPAAFFVEGGGMFCDSTETTAVGLSGSETGVEYRLMFNNSPTGAVLYGNGQALNFGSQQAAGTYTVVAATQAQCTKTMEGSAAVGYHARPLVLSSADQTIPGGTAAIISATASGGSDTYSFKWVPGNLVTNPQSATTSTVALSSTTLFQVQATDLATGCISKADSTYVFVGGVPLSADISVSSQAVCSGSMVIFSALPSGGSGTYTYIWKDPDDAIIGSGANLIINATKAGTYTLNVLDGSNVASASVDLAIHPLPEVFTLNGGGFLCTGGSGLPAMLSGSELGIEYRLQWNELITTAILYGTGSPLQFNALQSEGSYSAKAINPTSGCMAEMTGLINVTETDSIIIQTPVFQTIWHGQQATLEATVVGGSGNFAFQWSPAALVISPNSAVTQTLPLTTNTGFTLNVSDLVTGCSATTQSFVLVNNNTIGLELVAQSTSLCPEEQTTLYALASGGNGTISYSWTSNPAGFQSNVYNPVVSPIVPTKYYVSVTDGITTMTDSIQITLKPAPARFEVSGGGIVCSGNSTTSILLSNSESSTTYTLWRNGTATGQSLTGNGQALSFAGIAQAGAYTITGQKGISGCSSVMEGSATVESFTPPTAFAGPDQQIASGQAALLSGTLNGGSGNYNYFWNPSYLTLSPNQSSTYTLPLNQSTLFLFYGSDLVSGCASQVDTTIVIVTGGSLTVGIYPNSNTVCAGQSVLLTAVPGGGTGNYSFVWRNEAGQVIGNESILSFIPPQTTQVTVEIADGAQSQTASADIIVRALPQIYHVTGGGGLCPGNAGLPVGLETSEGGVLYTLQRDLQQALLTVVGQGDPINFGNFAQEGIYTVEAIAPEAQCAAMMAGSALIQEHNAPEIIAGDDQVVFAGQTAQLSSIVFNGSGNYAYQWQPADMLWDHTIPNPTSKPLENSVLFSVDVTDNITGCGASDQTYVFVAGNQLSLQLELSDDAVCPGTGVSCTALVQGGTGNYSWWWTSRPAGMNSGNATTTIFPQTSVWLRVTVSDGLSSVSDSVFIQVFEKPANYVLSGGGSWCAGSEVPLMHLSGSEAGQLYSLFRDGIYTGQSFTGTGNSLNLNVNAGNGTYTLVATNSHGCEQMMEGSAVLNQQQAPATFTLTGGGVWCEGDRSAGMMLSGSQAGVVYRLLYNNEETAAVYNGTGQPISFAAPPLSGNYSMRATYESGNCERPMAGSATALYYPIPEVMIDGPDSVCLGSHVTLTASGADTYIWLTDPPASTQSLTLQPESSVEIGLIATNSFGCSDTTSHSIEVQELPVFEVFEDTESRSVFIEANAVYPQYRFYVAGQLLSEGPETTYTYGYGLLPSDTITVEAESQFGCIQKAWIVLQGSTNEITINAFSPNGDQINDKFLAGYNIRIFNRWGVELYAGADGWDGRYNGARVADGTYYYIMEIRDLNGLVVRTEKGSVTIITE